MYMKFEWYMVKCSVRLYFHYILMIPKKIHYVRIWWKEMPDLAKKCIESRRKYLPDYELCLWNEKNFDLNSNKYVKQAYDAKKFAFVWDYIRVRAMYTYWWISMDTDVEVLKNLDKFLDSKWFSWFESKDIIPTWIMSSEKGNEFIWEILTRYQDRDFDPNNLVPNTIIITKIAKEKYWFKWWKNKLVKLWGDIYEFYPESYFCPKSSRNRCLRSKDCYTIHHFAWSRVEQSQFRKNFVKFCSSILKFFWLYSFALDISKKIHFKNK